MSLAILIVLAAILSLVIIISVAASRTLASPARSTAIHPVDIEAFRNLVDPAEADYLRRHLPAREFRRVQRKRLRAAAAYVQTAGRNAALLVHVGQVAINSNDVPTKDAARQLVDQALLLRRNATFAMFRISIAGIWPSGGFGAAPILDGYYRLNRSAMLLGRLQDPTKVVRLSNS